MTKQHNEAADQAAIAQAVKDLQALDVKRQQALAAGDQAAVKAIDVQIAAAKQASGQ